MKKIKIFLMMIALMAVSLTTLTVAHAKEKEEIVCVPYSIECDKGTINGIVCGTSTQEIVEKVWAMAVILCR